MEQMKKKQNSFSSGAMGGALQNNKFLKTSFFSEPNNLRSGSWLNEMRDGSS